MSFILLVLNCVQLLFGLIFVRQHVYGSYSEGKEVVRSRVFVKEKELV